MKNKFLSALALFLFMLSSAIAQDSTSVGKNTPSAKIREFHFAIANINPVNVQVRYKKQLKNRMFGKISLVNLSYNQNNDYPNYLTFTKSQYLSAGIELGLEFRSSLDKHFAFYHGPNVLATYQSSRNTAYWPQQSFKQESYVFAIPYTLGLLVNLKNHFFIAGEISPSISYTQRVGRGEGEQLNVGFNNGFALIALVYRL